MGRDEKQEAEPASYQDSVGVAWRDGNIYDDREGIARTWHIVSRALNIGGQSLTPAAAPARNEPPER